MESSAILTPSQLPYLFPSKSNKKKAYPSWPCSKPRTSQPTRLHCQKMYVPGFGEASPEAKGAQNLHNFFTYIAVRIVAAQLQDWLNNLYWINSSFNSCLPEQSYNTEAYKELMEFMDRHSLNDGDKFCASLMRESSRHKGLGTLMINLFSILCYNIICMTCDLINGIPLYSSYKLWHLHEALRILEVRSAYCKNDFEWDNLKRVAVKMVDDSNTSIMRDYVLETSQAESEK
uniref:Uncharacterized protein n=1 Tax=Quercus lobata TaxID=97700 RepID=A0A7N2LT49_QUELO